MFYYINFQLLGVIIIRIKCFFLEINKICIIMVKLSLFGILINKLIEKKMKYRRIKCAQLVK